MPTPVPDGERYRLDLGAVSDTGHPWIVGNRAGSPSATPIPSGTYRSTGAASGYPCWPSTVDSPSSRRLRPVRTAVRERELAPEAIGKFEGRLAATGIDPEATSSTVLIGHAGTWRRWPSST